MRFVVTLLFLVSPFVTCIVNNTKLLIGTKISLQYESLKETLRHRLQYSFNESHHDEATFDYKRIKYNPQLSAKTFYDLYEVTSTPVVIETPNISYWSSNHHQQWNAAFFKKHCGNALARIRIGHSISAPILEWELYYVKLSLYIDFLQGVLSTLSIDNGSIIVTDPNLTYLFDWPLSMCPNVVLDQFVLPRYFANDLLTLCEGCPFNENDWPSLFIGSSNMNPRSSQLHRDTFGSAFFSIQLVGNKIWRIFNRNDVSFLYPSLQDDVHFDITNVYSTEQQLKYPLLKFARFVDIHVRPGELLYVPAGLPHQVIVNKDTNDEDDNKITIMIGMNFVSLANINSVIEATQPKPLLYAFQDRINFTADDAFKKYNGQHEILYTKQKYQLLHDFFVKHQYEFQHVIDWDVTHQPWRQFQRRKLEYVKPYLRDTFREKYFEK